MTQKLFGLGPIIAGYLFAATAGAAPLPRYAEIPSVSDVLANRDDAIRLIDRSGYNPKESSGVGVEACKYYDDVGMMNSCRYHPYAKKYCETPGRNICIRLASPNLINVIRQELIIEDQKNRLDRSTLAGLPVCATAEAVAAYHKKVFASHGIPEWCFPFWWLSARGKWDR